MTTTTALRTFRLFSIETGHDFGVWTAEDIDGAILAMAEQAGDAIVESDIEAIEYEPGDIVVCDGEYGKIMEIYEGSAFVAWDQGVITPVECSSLAWASASVMR